MKQRLEGYKRPTAEHRLNPRGSKKSPMVQLHMAKAQNNEIHVILFFRKDGMRLTG
jgi:hypothetical protein